MDPHASDNRDDRTDCTASNAASNNVAMMELLLADLTVSDENARAVTSQEDPALEQLAITIKAEGLINPLTVVKGVNGYEVVAGFRRLRALRLLEAREPGSWARVRCSVMAPGTNAFAVSVAENMHRAEMLQREKCDAARRLVAQGGYELAAAVMQLSVRTAQRYWRVSHLPAEQLMRLDAPDDTRLSMKDADALAIRLAAAATAAAAAAADAADGITNSSSAPSTSGNSSTAVAAAAAAAAAAGAVETAAAAETAAKSSATGNTSKTEKAPRPRRQGLDMNRPWTMSPEGERVPIPEALYAAVYRKILEFNAEH